MTEFQAYLQLGFEHITDPRGYDHILFVMALCAVYTLKDWKKVVILVTAFTLGHSVTLVLATFQIVSFRSDVIEFLIPITILITAILNFFDQPSKLTLIKEEKRSTLRYPLALGFGLIHGLGFSNYLHSLLGKEESITTPLLAFNLGLEGGQLLIVALILLISFLITDIFKAQKQSWNFILSGIIAGMAISLILNNDFFQRIF
jgi:hypothetical protein